MRKLATVAIMALAVSSCGGGETAESTTTEAPTTTEATTTTSTSSTTTTTTTLATTTTTGASLGDLEATDPGQAAALFALSFATTREGLIPLIEDFEDVESVDNFNIDVPDTGNPDEDLLGTVLLLDVTSTWASEDNQVEGAWFITRALSVLWDRDEGGWYSEHWVPAFRLVNSGTTYECDGEFMVRVADQLAGMSDWLEACSA